MKTKPCSTCTELCDLIDHEDNEEGVCCCCADFEVGEHCETCRKRLLGVSRRTLEE